MADDPTPQDPPKDPDPAPADPPPADPPKDPEPAPVVPPDEDVVATRAENERLKAELEELKKTPKAPAPPKRQVTPKADPKAEPVEVKGKRRRRVSRLLGDHFDDDDE